MTEKDKLELMRRFEPFGREIPKDQVVSVIARVPTTERPKGEWIVRFDGNEQFCSCSVCKEQWYEDDLYMGGNEFPNYCPNCGSDNRERSE